MGGLEAIFRWMHVFAGIIWIGHLYFFNWVNGPLQAKLDGPTKKARRPGIDAARPVLVPLGSGIHLDHRVPAARHGLLHGQQALDNPARRMVGRRDRHDRRDVSRGVHL